MKKHTTYAALVAALVTGSLAAGIAPATADDDGGVIVDPMIGLVVKGHGHGAGADIVIANAIHQAAGAEAKLYRKTRHHRLRLIATTVLDDRGNTTWGVEDKNGRKKTSYKVRVAATDSTRKMRGGTRLR